MAIGCAAAALSGCGGGGDGTQSAPPATSAPAPASAPNPSLTITAIEPNPVLQRGDAQSWESSDVLNPSVIQFNGSLSNYYSGFDGKVWRSGLATSGDGGMTWQKSGAPVLDLGGWSTQYIAANGSAINFNGKVYYYYHGADSNGAMKIGLATSNDGTHFTALPSPVLDVGTPGSWDDAAVADPYVVQFGNTLYLYFLGENKAGQQLMGVATSIDGIAWTKSDAPLLPSGGPSDFDAHGQGEPAVVYAAPYYYMLYTGRASSEFRDLGWAVSTDAVHWTKMSQGLIPPSMRQAWDSQVICDPTILPTGKDDGTYYVWFGGGNKAEPAQGLDGQIGRMTIKIPTS